MLYASWQHGMELLGNIWGTDEANEGMNAFLERRPADFNQFRLRDQAALNEYLDAYASDRNQSEKSRQARNTAG
jgi:naphthoate synthase